VKWWKVSEEPGRQNGRRHIQVERHGAARIKLYSEPEPRKYARKWSFPSFFADEPVGSVVRIGAGTAFALGTGNENPGQF
jgi:hypothetical protein